MKEFIEMNEYDVFISYASEDKEIVARPLAKELKDYGLRVWFDEMELEIGDSIIEKIQDGLSKSRYGIVILSRNFFRRGWPQRELKVLMEKEIKTGKKVILPLWHDIDESYIISNYPFLMEKFALRTYEGLKNICEKIFKVIQGDRIGGPNVFSGSVLESSGNRDRVYVYLSKLYKWERKMKIALIAGQLLSIITALFAKGLFDISSSFAFILWLFLAILLLTLPVLNFFPKLDEELKLITVHDFSYDELLRIKDFVEAKFLITKEEILKTLDVYIREKRPGILKKGI
jgi:hypothetical protein